VAGEGAAPIIEAWNKIDLLDDDTSAALAAEAERRDDVLLLSAWTGAGMDAMSAALSAKLTAGARVRHVSVDMGDGASSAWLHAHGEVLDQHAEDDGSLTMEVRLSEADWDRFQTRHVDGATS
jgi:GTP-binding protein HflX